MRGAFQQVSALITQRFPGTEVVASEYPPTPAAAAAARAVQWLSYAAIGALLAGEKLFAHLGMPVPDYYRQNIANNAFPAGCFTWFASNLVIQQLTSSGAFEIYANEELVWSALAHQGRMPTIIELMDGLQHAGLGRKQSAELGGNGSGGRDASAAISGDGGAALEIGDGGDGSASFVAVR